MRNIFLNISTVLSFILWSLSFFVAPSFSVKFFLPVFLAKIKKIRNCPKILHYTPLCACIHQSSTLLETARRRVSRTFALTTYAHTYFHNRLIHRSYCHHCTRTLAYVLVTAATGGYPTNGAWRTQPSCRSCARSGRKCRR